MHEFGETRGQFTDEDVEWSEEGTTLSMLELGQLKGSTESSNIW